MERARIAGTKDISIREKKRVNKYRGEGYTVSLVTFIGENLRPSEQKEESHRARTKREMLAND